MAVLSVIAVWLAQYSKEVFEGRARVIDGDSLVLNGRSVRLLGIDAPELDQLCQDRNARETACGKSARRFLADLTSMGDVTCTTYRQDQYDRWLAVCKAGETELNREMVRAGWAVAYGDFATEERDARERGVGLWALTFEKPSQWRQDKSRAHVLGVFELLF